MKISHFTIHEVHDVVSVVGTHNANSADHEVALRADGRTATVKR